MTRILILFFLSIQWGLPAQADNFDALIDQRPPGWTLTHWINSPPLTLADLSGKVVLVRWWTAPYCPYCAASSIALNEWYEKYRDRGFSVVGIYHHKTAAPLDADKVAHYAERLGFQFPVAIDEDWKTLNAWWLGKMRQPHWTSVSFLIDRQGIIRHFHPGGKYVKGDPAYLQIQSVIEMLLQETK